ncbi:hypothetical protein B4U79_18384 [Dinothrombium tinctorium]|uniref:O-methyltransferase dimerisation domain-containing protein n=1 Tax=Dinothrombium tinctorium TaxID=1965070 RepID=A0A3S3RPP1_9ACAR|nr:hypothetical protein B4U79_18384 [Dinothrombium tinctorium]
MSENSALLNRFIQERLRGEIVCLATQLNLVAHLLSKPMSADDLAQIIQVHSPSLNRLPRYLMLFGILDENGGIFSVTPLGSLLSECQEESVKHRFIYASNIIFKVAKHFG